MEDASDKQSIRWFITSICNHNLVVPCKEDYDSVSVFWKQWFDRGVTFISDLMNSNGKFLTFEEFQNRFEIKANYLHYFQLIAAIPPDLKRKAFGSTVPDLLGATSEYCQIEDRTVVLTKL